MYIKYTFPVNLIFILQTVKHNMPTASSISFFSTIHACPHGTADYGI